MATDMKYQETQFIQVGYLTPAAWIVISIVIYMSLSLSDNIYTVSMII